MTDFARFREPGQTPRAWNKGQLLLGAVLLIAGALVLADIALVATISVIAIAGLAMIAGLVTMLQRATTRSWGSLLWRLALGILYISFGLLLIYRPEFQAAFLRLALAAALVASGILRIWLGVARRAYRWLPLSGAVGAIGGAAILLAEGGAEVRFVAAVLGIDLLVHGVVWIVTAVRAPRGNPVA
ncbi:MAG: DUF308 domain-containing protein [Sphingomonas sp.]|uniref:DUF308 domain-containing protein n=1 Tax=Sphingomonas sp. TaxID=28214 RepID=UPI001B0DD9BF|nr:DUF308 domain-containing protein [Sphingomonas sp.]MBO9623571.1 DUF308 domain-containing protein [Sphingomonas sp.]